MDIVYGVFIFILCTCIGSFLNVVIYRLPNKMSLAKPASHCPKCNTPIKWYDNVPIFSYIILGGKCRHCKEPISPRYLIVELTTGIISTLIYVRFGLTLYTLFGIIIFLTLIPIAFIDIEHFIIPDSCIIILLLTGILGIFFNDLNYGDGTFSVGYKSKLISLAIIVGFWFIIFLLEKLFKRDLMGGGDLKLLGVAGLILGFEQLLLVLGLASILACIFELIIKAVKKKEEGEEESNLFAFGPYLAFSILIIYLFGINIIEWWMSLLTI